jgi:hypothetical protein
MVSANGTDNIEQRVYDDSKSSTTSKHKMVLPEIEPQIWYATSNTPAGTAAKIATLVPDQPTFKRTQGAMICVSFDAANTAIGTLTLDIEDTGAADIIHNIASTATVGLWQAHQMAMFVFDGTHWEIINPVIRTPMMKGANVTSAKAANLAAITKGGVPNLISILGQVGSGTDIADTLPVNDTSDIEDDVAAWATPEAQVKQVFPESVTRFITGYGGATADRRSMGFGFLNNVGGRSIVGSGKMPILPTALS